MEERRGSSGVPWLILLGAVVAVVIGFFAWAAAGDDSAGPERGVTVEDIPESEAFDDDAFADSLVGRQVTVSGNVSEVIGSNAIKLGGGDFDGDGILILQVSGDSITEGDDVRVTGTVRDYDAAAFFRELGPGFDDDLYNRWVDENVLIASNVTMLDTTD